MSRGRSHPEVPDPVEVTDETRESLRDWARDLTRGAKEVVLDVHEETGFTQVSVQVDRNDPDSFFISCHEPSTDFTMRHTFLDVHPTTVDIVQGFAVDPEAGETPEQQRAISETIEEQDLLKQEVAPVADKEARARHVLDLIPRAHISRRE